MWQFLKIDKYDVQDGNLIVHKGFFKHEVIRNDEIKSWRVYPEMGMDVVKIEFNNGQVKAFVDKFDDLIGGLTLLAANKERH